MADVRASLREDLEGGWARRKTDGHQRLRKEPLVGLLPSSSPVFQIPVSRALIHSEGPYKAFEKHPSRHWRDCPRLRRAPLRDSASWGEQRPTARPKDPCKDGLELLQVIVRMRPVLSALTLKLRLSQTSLGLQVPECRSCWNCWV